MPERIITDRPVSTDTRVDEVVDRDHWLDPSRIVSLIAGIAFAVMGTIVLLDTGFDGWPSEPVTEFWGFPHTPLLGVIDIGIGVLLLAGAAEWSRGLSTFTAALMVVGGLVVALAEDEMPDGLQTSTGYGWFVAIVGAVILLVAMVMPTFGRRERLTRSAV